jgi:transmembrane sensor
MTRGSAKIGRVVREGVDVSMSAESHARLRRNVVQTATRLPRAASWRSPAFAVALVATALSLWLVAGNWQRTAPISFGVGNPRGGRIGAHYPTAPDSPGVLTFSDGSTVSLHAGGGARVTDLTASGATVRLESGRAEVNVVPRAEASWEFTAGPFTVLVVGTSFELAWDPRSGTLEIQMRSGTVVVHGPGLPTSVEVSGTERFVRQVPAVAAPSDVRIEEPASAPPAFPGASTPPPTPSAPLVSARENPQRAAPEASWSELAQRGEYTTIVASAERAGLASVLTSASAGELSLLADAARYERRPTLARQALTTIRKRFPGSPQAASAAFLIGRMQDTGAPEQALQWYDAYLQEAPGGTLAAEAHGRRMLALKRLGNLEGARQAAQAYLKRYPSGAYARHAQELVAKLDTP